ncbi:MAG TPA: phospholipase D-like domain-containing protein [candidate division Zixibacteria bacterium]|nr:phospholipase D-like domain-containing protein [candidate division Zixibacteria bacterium]
MRRLAWGLLSNLILAAAVPAADTVVQTCFTPQTRCSALIIREVDRAKTELLIAVYAFTSQELADAVVRAKRRGVNVQVVIDREFDTANERSRGRFLESQRVAVRRVSGARSDGAEGEAGLMHQKFAIVDRSIVFTGSYNWTYAADRFNEENLLMFRNAGALAEEYRKAFTRLWEKKN